VTDKTSLEDVARPNHNLRDHFALISSITALALHIRRRGANPFYLNGISTLQIFHPRFHLLPRITPFGQEGHVKRCSLLQSP
jgi:hypothetical protein